MTCEVVVVMVINLWRMITALKRRSTALGSIGRGIPGVHAEAAWISRSGIPPAADAPRNGGDRRCHIGEV